MSIKPHPNPPFDFISFSLNTIASHHEIFTLPSSHINIFSAMEKKNEVNLLNGTKPSIIIDIHTQHVSSTSGGSERAKHQSSLAFSFVPQCFMDLDC